MSPPCPNCGCAADGPALHGTPLVLCPVCWTVVDPTAPPPAPPPKPGDRGWILAEVVEPEPVPAETLSAFDLSRLPPCPPRPHGGAIITPGILIAVVVLLLALPASIGAWRLLAYYPSFRDRTAPNSEFTLAFPGEPYWQPQLTSDHPDEVGPNASLTRPYRGQRVEVYAVQVLRAPNTAYAQPGTTSSLALSMATRLAGVVYSADVARPRLAKLPGYVCADFVRVNWLNTPTTTTAGRVIVEADRYYILTVSGPDVGLDDWRVRRFFDSFRLAGR